ncbi:hypothetical protein ACI2VD_25730, partial [Ralstonia nicotianae]
MEQLRTHVLAFVRSYNFGKHLKRQATASTLRRHNPPHQPPPHHHPNNPIPPTPPSLIQRPIRRLDENLRQHPLLP